MSSDTSKPEIDRFTCGIIRRKAAQLIGRAGFTKQDREDLEQELLLRVLQSLPMFDPDRSHRNQFITVVVERYVANLLRNKQAAKRADGNVTSLNVTIQLAEEGAVEFVETISQRELDARRGTNPRSDQELAQLVSDVAEAIAVLPQPLRELARRRKWQSVTQIAKDAGVPRTTLVGRIGQIRKRFEEAGLKDYLQIPSSSGDRTV